MGRSDSEAGDAAGRAADDVDRGWGADVADADADDDAEGSDRAAAPAADPEDWAEDGPTDDERFTRERPPHW